MFWSVNSTNRPVRQLNAAKYAVVSIIQHCMTKQNKSNVQQQLFQNKNARKDQPTVSSGNKTADENTIIYFKAKGQQNKNSNSRYGQCLNDQNQTNPERRNLIWSSINQFFSINQRSNAPKSWYEKLQLIPVSFLKGNEAFDTYALIDPGSQCSFVLDAISEYL